MTQAGPNTNADLHRGLGRVEGEIAGMKEDVSEIKFILKDISARLAKIESSDAERKGAWWTLAAIAAIVGTLFSTVVGHFWK